jgi:hypothetical protein
MIRKVLYSPGYGAGWTTWASGKAARLMLEWPPLIDALERGEKLTENHPAVQSLIQEITAMGEDPPYLGGLRDLRIQTGEGQVRIEEYDGSESVHWRGDDSEWM